MISSVRETLDRAPPHDLGAEAALNGAAILKPDSLPAMVEAGYRPGIFYDEDNRQLAAAILAARAEHGTVDETLILAALRPQENSLAGKSATALLIRTLEGTPHAANWPHHLHLVRECWAKRQTLLIGGRMLTASMNGAAAADIVAEATRALEDIRDGAGGKVLTYRRLTCAELDAAEYAIDYIVEWLLVSGQPCIVAGPKKALKTSILLDLAVALATGGHFLGMFRVVRAVRVCVMSGESGMATIQETLRRIAAAAGYKLAGVQNLVVSDQLPVFGDLRHIDALRKFLTDDEISVLVIDPAYLCVNAGGNEGSLFAMGELLRGMIEMCQSIGITLVLAHHTRKNVVDQFAAPELEDISWSGFQEIARQWLLLGRRERYEPGTGHHRLWMNCGGSAGHSSLWAVDVAEGAFDGTTPRTWQVSVSKAEDARRDAEQQHEAAKLEKQQNRNRSQLDADKGTIIRVIGDAPQGDTKTSIRDKSGIRSARFDAALAELLANKSIIAITITKGNNREYEGFKLKPESD